jgi:hypothetical protein
MGFSQEWMEDSRRWRGRVLTGRCAHWCPDWDYLPIDETTPEWPCVCADYFEPDWTAWKHAAFAYWAITLMGIAKVAVCLG